MREEPKTRYVTFKLINFIVLCKYALVLNLMPATPSREAVSRGHLYLCVTSPSLLTSVLEARTLTVADLKVKRLNTSPPSQPPLNSAKR